MARKAKKQSFEATETSVESSASSGDAHGPNRYTFDQKLLSSVCKLMASVADRKSTMPMLARMLVRYTTTGTTIAATDLNVSLVADLPVFGDRGGFTVPAKEASDLIAKLPTSVEMSSHGSYARLTSGSISTTLESMPDRDFPRVPDATVDTAVWSDIDARALVGMINRVKHSVCKDETRFHLNGIHVSSEEGNLVLVSTDGHRLTRCAQSVDGAPHVGGSGKIIPMSAITPMLKVIGKADRCSVWFADTHLFVKVGIFTFATKYIDAQFPPIEQLIPKEPGKLATVARDLLMGALERASTLCSDTRGVKLTIGNGKIRINADHPDLGSMSESFPAEGKAASAKGEFSIGANHRYLMEALKVADDSCVTFSFEDELAPMQIRSFADAISRPISRPTHMSIVMPMRI